MRNDNLKKNHSRITIVLEGQLHKKLEDAIARSLRSKRAEIYLRIQDSLLRFEDLPAQSIDENSNTYK